MTTYEQTSGSIVHVELLSDDHDGTRAVLESAFGWTFERDEGMDYLMWRAPNPPSGGLVGEETWPDTASSTVLYLGVADLDAACEAVVEAGGDLLVDGIEVPGMGAFAVFRDPGGVVNAAWEERYEGAPPEGGWPAFTDDPESGSVAHVELYSEDPDATAAFYGTVFGWTFEPTDDEDYTMAFPPTPPNGGVMRASDADDVPVGALLYLLVPSAETARADVEAAGGRVLREPFAVDQWGTLAVFEAPGGTTFAAWEPAEDGEATASGADARRAA